eukprot:6867474-Alexandrium_andersonii.AAC.1
MKANTFCPRKCSSQMRRAKSADQISAWPTTCVLPGCRHACHWARGTRSPKQRAPPTTGNSTAPTDATSSPSAS